MQRRRVSLVVVAAMAGVCAGVVGIQGTLRADTPDANAEQIVQPRSGWGEPKHGLQIGLFAQTGQKTFRYGDTIVLVMRARNVSIAPINLTVNARSNMWVTLCEKGRILLEPLGGESREVPLHIAPGETLELPGIRYAAQIVAPGEQAGGMQRCICPGPAAGRVSRGVLALSRDSE